MTGCDSQTALKQNKRQWQFAASSATVTTPTRKLNVRYSAQGSFKQTVRILVSKISLQIGSDMH